MAADADEPDTSLCDKAAREPWDGTEQFGCLVAGEQAVRKCIRGQSDSPRVRSSGIGDIGGLVLVIACAGGGAEREFGGRGGGVAGSGVGPGVHDQDHGVIERATPGIALALGMPLGAAVGLAVAAQLAEGSGVAARFGEEVPAVAEHVGPFAQPGPGGDVAAVAEFPGGATDAGGDGVPPPSSQQVVIICLQCRWQRSASRSLAERSG